MKKVAAILALTLMLAAGTTGYELSQAETAEAHTFGTTTGGPPHTHWAGCAPYNCYRWILANGTVHQGPQAKLLEHRNYVLVLCSAMAENGVWNMVTFRFGPFDNIGVLHPYCKSPTSANGTWWPRLP